MKQIAISEAVRADENRIAAEAGMSHAQMQAAVIAESRKWQAKVRRRLKAGGSALTEAEIDSFDPVGIILARAKKSSVG